MSCSFLNDLSSITITYSGGFAIVNIIMVIGGFLYLLKRD